LTLGRVFIGRRVVFAHRTSNFVWTVGGIDPRPAATIYFGKPGGDVAPTSDGKLKKKKKQRHEEKKVCIADYLTQHAKYAFYFVQHPLKFATTLPCFNMANKDGRLDSFPMDTCLIVLDPRTDAPSSPSGGGVRALASTPTAALAAAGYGDNDGDETEGGASLREPHLVQVLADGYKLWPDAQRLAGSSGSSGASEFGAAAALCRHNGGVARAAGAGHLALAWAVLAALLAPAGSLLAGDAGFAGETEEEDEDSAGAEAESDGDNYAEEEEEEEEEEEKEEEEKEEEKKDEDAGAGESDAGEAKKVRDARTPPLRTTRSGSSSGSGGEGGTKASAAAAREGANGGAAPTAGVNVAAPAGKRATRRGRGSTREIAELSPPVAASMAAAPPPAPTAEPELLALPWLFEETVRKTRRSRKKSV
jgi:hypothetical protein